MNTSLNDLDFDINTLIPYDQFNWDCVDGIQCVIDDVNKVMATLAGQIAIGLATVETTYASVINQLQNHVVGSIDFARLIPESIQRDLQAYISAQIAGLPQSGGMGSKPLRAWIVFRETGGGQLYPVVEIWDDLPIGVIGFGPFPNYYAIWCLISAIGQPIPNTATQSYVDSVIRDDWTAQYQSQGNVEYHGVVYSPNDVFIDTAYGEQGYGASPIMQRGVCNIAAQPANNSATSGQTIPATTPTDVILPTPIDNPIQGPLPNGEYTQYPSDGLPQIDTQLKQVGLAQESSGKSENTPIEPDQTISLPITQDCCQSIVTVLGQIRDRLTPQVAGSDGDKLTINESKDIPDDKYVLSQEYQRDVSQYLNNTVVSSISQSADMSLSDALLDMLALVRKPYDITDDTE